MTLNVGVNVLEVDGRASPSIEAAPTSVAAFIGRTARGVPNKAVRITSPAQFRERFGAFLAPNPSSSTPSLRTGGYLGYAIEGFFLNGGREAYVCRVTGAGGAAAALMLNNRASTAAPALRVSAGFRQQEEPGKWGERLRIDVRDDPRAQTQVVSGSTTSAVLQSLSGLRVGSVVRFGSGATPDYRRLIQVDPASATIGWSTVLGAAPTAGTQITSAEFRLVVCYQDVATSPFTVVEEWGNLSMETDSPDYAIDRVNHPFTGSRFIVLADASGIAASGVENPAVTSNQALTGSTETAPAGTDFVGSPAQRTGLYAFETAQVQLLAVPDAHAFGAAERQTVVRGALDYCAARGDCTFVGSAPDRALRTGVVTPRSPSDYNQYPSAYLQTVKTYSALFQGSKVYGAMYAPWIQVSDAASGGAPPTRFIPADGHVMGVYARTEMERGIWKAPAGNAALVRGALDVAAGFSDGEHTDMVRSGFVNGIRALPGLGITVTASRTLSTDTRWWFVGTRLLFNFVKSSLRDGLRFVRQEPHTEELRRSVRLNVVRPFLLGLWRRGAFGSDPADKVFTIKCDAENNPPPQVDLGYFQIEVYFYPVKPAETILIIVGQQPSGASASDA